MYSQTMVDSEKITIRRHPYPFKASLSIADDLDNLNWQDFVEIRKFLNTNLDTSMGKGLGLEIGETFWCYSLHPDEVTYFEGCSSQESSNAPVLRELIQSGFVDCFHSFGNFSRWENPGKPMYFNRKLAENAINELLKHNIRFDTYINHGDNFNIQNVYAQLIRSEGDDPNSDAYHTDLAIREMGTKYYWAADLTAVVGQDRKLRLSDYEYHLFKTGHQIKNLIKGIIGRNHKIRKVFGNDLLRKVKLRDGQILMEFTRYCYKYSLIYSPPDRNILKKQMSEGVLDGLEKFGGFMIIYTHFGQPVKRTSKHIFDDGLVERFNCLKQRSLNGQIMVTTTSRLLNYNYLINHIKWKAEKRRNGVTAIQITGLGGPLKINPQYHGLTFYCPEPEKTIIYISDKKVDSINVNPPDYTGRKSISIPIPPLQFPDDIF